jgi:hypothetical protein
MSCKITAWATRHFGYSNRAAQLFDKSQSAQTTFKIFCSAQVDVEHMTVARRMAHNTSHFILYLPMRVTAIPYRQFSLCEIGTFCASVYLRLRRKLSSTFPQAAKGMSSKFQLDPFEPVALSEIYANETWTKVTNFIYADGTIYPPKLLRDVPEQNYLNNVIRGVGLTLMGVVLLLALTTIAWVYLNREHRVLRAAQPPFLYMLALGSAISASTIVPISFDESYGWSEQQLSRACMAIPWLLSLGHILTYGTLFSKLWRINKVLQFSRRKIDAKQVAWPATLLAVSALLVLSSWTGLDDSLGWHREEINEITGESIGECHFDHMTAFLAPLVVLMVLPTIMTGVMAWKTKDVDGAYSESQWIFTMIVVQMEVIVVAVPTITILRDVSTDGRYLGLMFLVLAFPMSALGFIMLPKVSSYYEAVNSRVVSRRGNAKGSVWVSGLNGNPYAPDSRKEVGARLGSAALNTETPTSQDSTAVVEPHSSSEIPSTELPQVQEEP